MLITDHQIFVNLYNFTIIKNDLKFFFEALKVTVETINFVRTVNVININNTKKNTVIFLYNTKKNC